MVDILNLFKRIKKLKRSKRWLEAENTRLSEENDFLIKDNVYLSLRLKKSMEGQAHDTN
jgi:hypothetical protein